MNKFSNRSNQLTESENSVNTVEIGAVTISDEAKWCQSMKLTNLRDAAPSNKIRDIENKFLEAFVWCTNMHNVMSIKSFQFSSISIGEIKLLLRIRDKSRARLNFELSAILRFIRLIK